jgi:hypothetical protein
MSGGYYCFGGRTSKVHTGTAKIFLFCEGDVLASFGEIVCQWNACLACTDD